MATIKVTKTNGKTFDVKVKDGATVKQVEAAAKNIARDHDVKGTSYTM